MALTDNLNFGNPERPGDHGPVGRLHPAASRRPARRWNSRSCPATCRSTTRPTAARSCRRPTIGGVGLLDDFAKSASIGFKAADETILLLGETKGWLGQSLYLREICGREEGAPPPVDLDGGAAHTAISCAALIDETLVTAVHDISDGGLLVALAEMAIAAGIGARLYGAPAFLTAHGFWFGEDQARYVVTSSPSRPTTLMRRARKPAGVPVRRIGLTAWQCIDSSRRARAFC